MAARNDAFVKPCFELLRKKSSYPLISEGRRICQLNLLTLGKQGHRIVASRMQSERSYELYSRLFVQRLRVLAPELEDGCAYRLHGSVISSKRVAVFPLETLQRVDKQEFVSL